MFLLVGFGASSVELWNYLTKLSQQQLMVAFLLCSDLMVCVSSVGFKHVIQI